MASGADCVWFTGCGNDLGALSEAAHREEPEACAFVDVVERQVVALSWRWGWRRVQGRLQKKNKIKFI